MARVKRTGPVLKTQRKRTTSKTKASRFKRVERYIQVDAKGPKVKVRSGLEERIGEWLFNNTIAFSYEPDKFKYKHIVPGKLLTDRRWEEPEGTDVSGMVFKWRTYTPDFYIKEYKFYIEGKGVLSREERQKFESIKRHLPNLDIRFVFHRDNWITKAHRERYSGWADRMGFPYSIELPHPAWFSTR